MQNNPYLYVLLNGELGMTAGKAAAQTAHAVAQLHKEHGLAQFSDFTQRTVIVLEAKDGEQIKNLKEYLDKLKINASYYVDEGVNEIAPYSVTAMAIGPIWGEDLGQRELLKGFKLYPHNVNRYSEAYDQLSNIQWDLLNGLEDNTPWYFRKTMKWLRKRK